MIKPLKHDQSKAPQREDQQAFLDACPPEDRRFHELMFTYGNIVYRYHQQSQEFEPSEEDYLEWLEGLPENVQRHMRQLGFEKCRSVLSFTRYVLEKNDVGQEEYVRQHMDSEDYAAYRAMVERQEP
ncbi:hypothetical protein [Pontibacter harenae]|uniref:hypothetical protein n=1 Tax=Pontibacter harenae TaxID=2894083 RepID=UPI001E564662|nr:hypothetical protein [Pontibacter harenae]MCC9167878.1 hypothetical protein [Pontibacter harenae]